MSGIGEYNITIQAEPAWTRPYALATELCSIVIFSIISIAVLLIIIGRNIIPSLFFDLHNCCFRGKRKVRRMSTQSEYKISNICHRREVTTVSLFFVFFYTYVLYRVWTAIALGTSFASQVATDGSVASYIVMVVADGFDYFGYLYFFFYFCFYIVVLSHVASIWFLLFDFDSLGKRRKIFLSIVGIIITVCIIIGGIIPILIVLAVVWMEIIDINTFYTIVFSVGAVHMTAHIILTLLAIGIIIFIIVMIVKHSKVENLRTDQSETVSKLKIYSIKLIFAIVMLLLASIARLVGVGLIGLKDYGVPLFPATIIGRVIPDVLDMTFSVIIYWPFPLFCVQTKTANSVLKKVLNPINFAALYDKAGKTKPSEPDTPNSPNTTNYNSEQQLTGIDQPIELSNTTKEEVVEFELSK